MPRLSVTTLIVTMVTVIVYLSACSTKFSLLAPYKSQIFVYAELDSSDTAHYVRIQKSFINPNQSAYTAAQVSDSSFYLNLNVSVKEIDPATHMALNTIPLTKVKMSDENMPKDTGIFFTDPSWAYKFKYALRPKYQYRLIIYNPVTKETDSAQTCILADDSSYQGFYVSFFDRPLPIQFGPTARTSQINPDVEVTFDGNKAPDSTYFVYGIFRAHWVDRDTTTGIETDHSYDWRFSQTEFPAPTYGSTSGFLLHMPVIDFINAYKKGMGPAPANVLRYLDSSDITIWAGTAEIYNYQQFYQFILSGYALAASNTGPHPYSNIAGNNAYGVFTSVAHRTRVNIQYEANSFQYIVTYPTLDSMRIQSVGADH